MRSFILSFFISLLAIGNMAHSEQSEKAKVIILMGPPGSGKGTQATRVTQALHIPHISTGDILRENIKNDTELGRKAKEYMNAGKLVPDELVLDMLANRISKPDSAKGYLLDGFPRTIAQGEAFDKLMKPNAHLVAINLEVSDEAIVKRMSGRLTCKDCGNVQNIYFSPPAKEGVCDKCGGTLTQRPDDKPEVVKERLRVYHEQTKPLIDFYQKKKVLFTINGEQNPDAVFSQIMSKVQ